MYTTHQDGVALLLLPFDGFPLGEQPRLAEGMGQGVWKTGRNEGLEEVVSAELGDIDAVCDFPLPIFFCTRLQGIFMPSDNVNGPHRAWGRLDTTHTLSATRAKATVAS